MLIWHRHIQNGKNERTLLTRGLLAYVPLFFVASISSSSLSPARIGPSYPDQVSPRRTVAMEDSRTRLALTNALEAFFFCWTVGRCPRELAIDRSCCTIDRPRKVATAHRPEANKLLQNTWYILSPQLYQIETRSSCACIKCTAERARS